MKSVRLKSLAIYLGIVVVGGALGSVLGGFYGDIRADAQAEEVMQEVRNYLSVQAPGIRQGRPFPEIVVQADYESEGRLVGDLLPDGGLILYVTPSCSQCENAMVNLAKAQKSLGNGMPPLLLLVEGDARDIANFITPLGLKAQVYSDVTSALAKEHGIRIYPCYFRLDANMHITGYGPVGQKPEDVMEIAR